MAVADGAFGVVAIWTAYLIGDPDLLDAVTQTVAIFQVVVAAVIAGIAWEDGKAKENKQ